MTSSDIKIKGTFPNLEKKDIFAAHLCGLGLMYGHNTQFELFQRPNVQHLQGFKLYEITKKNLCFHSLIKKTFTLM